mgnify:CR=1 FL=1
MLALQYFDDTFDTNKSEYDFRLLVRMFEVPLFRFKMQQSVTLKARVDELQTTEEAVFELTESLGTLFEQEDVYFNVPHGNLKLRIMKPNASHF